MGVVMWLCGHGGEVYEVGIGWPCGHGVGVSGCILFLFIFPWRLIGRKETPWMG